MKMVDLFVVLGTALLAGCAAYWLAVYKRRADSAKGWCLLALLLPITLPILTFLKPRAGDAPRHWFTIPLVAVANLVVVGQIATWLGLAAYQGGTGIPTCDSAAARNTAVEAVANSPLGKTWGVNIVSLSQIKEVSSEVSERRCSANALLNNGVDRIANYKMFVHHASSQWILTVEFSE